MDEQARYYMIGGFLGAGKTTAVAALAQHLTKTGRRVGLTSPAASPSASTRSL
jgi:signal recognition particle GTPase